MIAINTSRHCQQLAPSPLVEGDVARRIIRRHVRLLLRHPAFTPSDRDDVEQELAIELSLKRRKYDPARAAEAAFIKSVIRNKAVSLVRVKSAGKRDYRRNGRSLNETMRDEGGNPVQRADLCEASVASRHTGRCRRSSEELALLISDMREVLNGLPAEMRDLAEQLKDQPAWEISRATGRSRRSIAHDISRIRRRFEDAGLRDYL